MDSLNSLAPGPNTCAAWLAARSTTLAGYLLMPGAITVINCLLWRVGPHWQIPRRITHDVMLFLPIQGRLIVRFRERDEALTPGQMAVLPPGLPQAIRYAPGHQALTVAVAHLHARSPQGAALLGGAARAVFPIAEYQRAALDFARIAADLQHDPLFGQAYGATVFARLLAEVAIQHPDHGQPIGSTDPLIAGSLATIHAEHGRGVDLADLAAAAGLRPVQFRVRFARAVGQSPKTYLDKVRLAHAADRLTHSDDSVAQIAEQAGFASLRQFQIRFKHLYRSTPSGYRTRPGMESPSTSSTL